MNQIVRLNGRFLLGNIEGGKGLEIRNSLPPPSAITKFLFEGIPSLFIGQQASLRWIGGEEGLSPSDGVAILHYEDPYWSWVPQGDLLSAEGDVYGFLRIAHPQEETFRWNSETFRIYIDEAPPIEVAPPPTLTSEDFKKIASEIYLYKKDVQNSQEVLGGIIGEAGDKEGHVGELAEEVEGYRDLTFGYMERAETALSEIGSSIDNALDDWGGLN